MSTKQKIYEKFASGECGPCTDAELAAALGMRRSELKYLREILHDLCDEGKLLTDGAYRYGTPSQFSAQRGTISGNERGFGFFVPEDRSLPDLFIPHGSLHGALHKDVVYAIPVGGKQGDEGEVLGIVERGCKQIVGTFVRDNRAGYLIPDERKFWENVYIPLKKCSGIRPNVKAVAKITDYPKGKTPGGEIIEVLGDDDDFFAEELSIIRSYNLREEFPASVLEEAETVSRRPVRAENRLDLRGETIVTIDGEDTRDIDDAISLTFDGSRYTLGVHIADVSEYVRAKSPLDREALERGTSVYFPDRVLPMLPKALSNGCCSLNEGEDRLALSCIMTIDKNGEVRKRKLAKSVIRSSHRMTYRQADAVLNGETDEFADVREMLLRAKELTELLAAKRRERGNVELDIREAKIYLDENDQIVIPDYAPLFSYGLIEQFMVLANETVASLMTEAEMPFVYRIHERPAPEKAENFLAFAKECGSVRIFHQTDTPQNF